MWFGVTMWTVFTTSLLICTCSAYSSYSDFDSTISGPSSYKGDWNDEERNNYLYDTDVQRSGKYLDSWPEKDSLSRQLFGDKSVESPEVLKAGEKETINKRDSHSLSIVNPLDVLRQRLMLEMARRRMKENQDQIRQNEVILKNLGKRSAYESSADEQADEMRSNPDYLRRIHMASSEDFDV